MGAVGSTVSARAAGTLELGPYQVARLGYGAMRITGEGIWGEPEDPGGAQRVLQRAVELGVDFIDTAHAYGPEVSERLIGEALAPYEGPEGPVVVATKSGLDRTGPGQWPPDGRPEVLRRECERSRELLRLERLPLFQLHRPDPEVPFVEQVATLKALQDEGKVELVGLSNVSVEQLEEALQIVDVVSVQNRYGLFDRDNEDVLEACQDLGIVFIPWFPLGAGDLAREERLREIATANDATPAQVALAWLLRHSPNILPIPGTSKVAHLEENVAAAGLELSRDELAELDATG